MPHQRNWFFTGREKVLEKLHRAIVEGKTTALAQPQAVPLHQRALAIMENILPDHPNTATLLDNYADLLRKTNREAEAEKLEARTREIREKQRRET